MSAAAATVTGLAVFAAVAMDAGWQCPATGPALASSPWSRGWSGSCSGWPPASARSPSAARCLSCQAERDPSACRAWRVFFMRQNATRPPSCMRWRGPCPAMAPDRPVARPHGSGSAGRPALPFPISWFPSLTGPDRPVARPRCSGSSGCPDSPAPRAARRCQAPAVNTGFPAFPAARGEPRDGARFLRWRYFYALRPRHARVRRNLL